MVPVEIDARLARDLQKQGYIPPAGVSLEDVGDGIRRLLSQIPASSWPKA